MFDAGKWAMIPEESIRQEILRRLIEVKNEAKVGGVSKQISTWPHFTKVHWPIDVAMCKISLVHRFFSNLMVSIGFGLSILVCECLP
jgi:hypothetical protein